MAELSPMMKQYKAIKEQAGDSILFYRLGDFYEMFFEDALLASKELEISLTGRDCGQEEKAPMCGVPAHSCEGYIARLIEKGYKVSICEQTQDPSEAKGIVQRDIVRVVTAGTVIESSMLDESKNNYMAIIYGDDSGVAVVFADISTSEIYATEIPNDKNLEQAIKNELSKFNPTEVIINNKGASIEGLSSFIKEKVSKSIEVLHESKFIYYNHKQEVLNYFEKENSVELGLENNSIIYNALGGLLCYLKMTQFDKFKKAKELHVYSSAQFMKLDMATRRNLELTETMRNRDKKGSLLWVLDKTKTAMGKRLIRSYIERPLVNYTQIVKRLNATQELMDNTIKRSNIVETLSNIRDLERLITRISYKNSNARELRELCFSIGNISQLKEELVGANCQLLQEINQNMDSLEDIYKVIDSAIKEKEIPVSVRDGGMINDGYSTELDELRYIIDHGQDLIKKIENQEKENTGIKSLKTGYNRIFGYYIEITNMYKDQVPSHYIRKQTLTGSERLITQELKEVEAKILTAKEKAVEKEYEIYSDIVTTVSNNSYRIQKTAHAIAMLDTFSSFASVSVNNKYSRPNINLEGKIELTDSRHPVVEALLNGKPFVPNDLLLDKDKNRFSIITGPNMSGKSTFMRQVAIIVIMAQIGCFVPSKNAQISIVDSVFTRVGASDDLTSGQSTFMVEMNEVANILQNATSDSLLIIDEIGRGTSTYDGMSIARAVVEYISDKKKIGAKTLFATHYHELTELEEMISGVNNYNIAVKKNGDDITFLRRIVKGGADQSYGIEVAKLAGVPNWVVARAKKILKTLEENEKPISIKDVEVIEEDEIQIIDQNEQIQISMDYKDKIVEMLQSLDINNLTPMQAMNTVYELWKKAQQ